MLRCAPLVLALVLACAAVSPATAGSQRAGSTHIIAQKTIKQGTGSLYLAHGLLAGHTYRVEVVSSGKYTVKGYGFVNYTYVLNRRLGQGSKPFTIKGKTPYSHTIQPPTKGRLTGWVLVVDAQITGKHDLTVRYRDLGKKS